MNKRSLILLLPSLVIIQLVIAQSNGAAVTYDTIPIISDLKRQHLKLDDRIRCVAYLFARNFIVKDSLGNFFVSLYYNKDNHETTPENIRQTAISLFNVTYYYAFEPILDYLKGRYDHLILTVYNKDGKIIFLSGISNTKVC